ncbi:MAG: polysulfide reductase NrfD [Caldilineaceae bacterium]|nr:polysulfide reductase NrfD [Caldilineaceae bacterium]
MTARSPYAEQGFHIGPFSRDVVVVSLLGCLTLIGAVAGLGRLFLGLAASTTLNNVFSWGIWIGFDFTLIALAGVGFTTAFLVHVLHLHTLKPVLRPALLAGFAGYTAVLLLLVLDLGRPDRFYSFLINWNLHSPLFEISWCVLLYTTVLVLELSPDCCKRLGWTWATPWLQRLITPVTILGVTLSTLHQSTLGTLYLNMPHRLDPLLYSPWLPLLFFTSAAMAGFSVAILVYKTAARVQDQAEDARVVSQLGRWMCGAALVYLTLKVADLLRAGDWRLLFTPRPITMLVWAELIVFLAVPLVLWIWARRLPWLQWIVPLLFAGGVMLNRFNATLFGQLTPAGAVYRPHILEWASTVGIVAGAMLVWYLGVRYLVAPRSLNQSEAADVHV